MKESSGTSRALAWSLDGLGYQPLIEKHRTNRLMEKDDEFSSVQIEFERLQDMLMEMSSEQIHKSGAQEKKALPEIQI